MSLQFIYSYETVCALLTNLLDGSDDDLRERVNQGLQDGVGVSGAQHTRPQADTVDKLPVVYRLAWLLQKPNTL